MKTKEKVFHFSGRTHYKRIPEPKSFKEWLLSLFGLCYKVNWNTEEIHSLDNKHKNCKTEMIEYYSFISRKEGLRLIESGECNGCRWCMPKFNKE